MYSISQEQLRLQQLTQIPYSLNFLRVNGFAQKPIKIIVVKLPATPCIRYELKIMWLKIFTPFREIFQSQNMWYSPYFKLYANLGPHSTRKKSACRLLVKTLRWIVYVKRKHTNTNGRRILSRCSHGHDKIITACVTKITIGGCLLNMIYDSSATRRRIARF